MHSQHEAKNQKFEEIISGKPKVTLAVFDIEYEGLRRRETTSGNPALRESVIGLDAMLTNAGRALFGYLVEPEVDVRAAEDVGCFEVDLGFNSNYGMARRASLAGVEQYIDPQPAVVMQALGLRPSDLADESEAERPEGWVEGLIPFLLQLNGRHMGRKGNASLYYAPCDTFRAAAIDQLGVWAERAGVTMIRQEMGSDPASVAFDTLIHCNC